MREQIWALNISTRDNFYSKNYFEPILEILQVFGAFFFEILFWKFT
jgi:hypothetical protein